MLALLQTSSKAWTLGDDLFINHSGPSFDKDFSTLNVYIVADLAE